MLKEFKAFAMRGNLLELATAFILGAAFTAVVMALVESVIMPFIAAIFGQPNFDKLTWTVGKGKVEYGVFLTALSSFLLVAFALFLIIRAAARVQPAPSEEIKKRECPYCLTLIPERARRCSSCTSEVAAAGQS